MVEFHVGNLLDDDYPSANGPLHDMDLILCRNVFIYMAPAQVARIVAKMIRTLRPGGALVTGHSEIQGVAREGLVSQHLPGSTVHFRQSSARRRPKVPRATRTTRAPSPPSHRPPARRPAPVASRPAENRPSRAADIGEAERLFDQGEYRRALDTLGHLASGERSQPRARRLETRIHLQLDDLKAARDAVEALLSRPGRQAEDYFLLALIQQAGDETAQAARTLNKALYLDPDMVAAYVHLALLLELQGNRSKAQRLRSTALERLRRLPPEAPVPHFEGQTAGELTNQLAGALETSDSPGGTAHG